MLSLILRNGVRLSLQRSKHTLLQRFYTQNPLKNTDIGKRFYAQNATKQKSTQIYQKNHTLKKYLFAILAVNSTAICLYNFNILNIEDIHKTFRKYVLNETSLKRENIIINQQDHHDIAQLIVDRNKQAKSYYLLFGPQGVGKSILATLATESAKKGVLYVDASDYSQFTRNLSQEIKKLNYLNYVWPVSDSSDSCDWKKVFHEFEKIAKTKKRKENYTPLLIIDNIRNKYYLSEMIKMIQHSAKYAAEHGNYNVMFITNDKMTVDFLLDNDAKSHMEIIYLGDLNEDVALSYLLKHEVDKDTAKEIYKIFGGRIIDLTHAINYFKRNKGNKNFLNDYIDMKSIQINNKFGCVDKENQSKVLEFLYNHSDRPFNQSEFKIHEINEKNIEIYNYLVRNNILTMSENFKTTFESPFTRYVFKNLYKA
ncbi:hypothetical protein C1645_828635 [Glomus cerebriforme]|uniref:P-loop containing nucleoside triphosphate hydrolase protein n=1 Tax=Glomus cerebriforme TaxID=658196 RepID=A0A397SQF9_9GLOM|nr:hypothetical protein C1645_828635 [Glomus cerebriforme]